MRWGLVGLVKPQAQRNISYVPLICLVVLTLSRAQALLGDQDGDRTSPGEVCGSTEQPTTELESPLAGLSPSPSLCKATTRAVQRSQRPTQTAAPHPRSRREREAAAHAACDTPPRPLWLLQGISQQETALATGCVDSSCPLNSLRNNCV